MTNQWTGKLTRTAAIRPAGVKQIHRSILCNLDTACFFLLSFLTPNDQADGAIQSIPAGLAMIPA